MLYREIIAVCSEIHTKHINTLCGQNVEFFLTVKNIAVGTCRNDWVLKDEAMFGAKQQLQEPTSLPTPVCLVSSSFPYSPRRLQ